MRKWLLALAALAMAPPAYAQVPVFNPHSVLFASQLTQAFNSVCLLTGCSLTGSLGVGGQALLNGGAVIKNGLSTDSLLVSGLTVFQSGVTGVTPSLSDDSTSFATTHWIQQQGYIKGTASVSSFNNRTGTVNLTSGDVTTALGFSPAPTNAASFVGGVTIAGGLTADTLTVTGNSTFSGTGYLRLPLGTTLQEPGSPTAGMVRWNTTTGRMEIYDGSVWRNFVRLSGDTITGALTVSGVATLSGGATTTTVATADNSTNVATTAWVKAQGYSTGGTSGVTTFDTRSGAVVLNSTDVTTALGFTPASISAPSFTGGVTVAGGASADTLSVSGSVTLTGTGALQLPSGTTLQEPGTPIAGMLRWNTTTSRMETYSGSAWQNHVRLSGDTMTGALTISSGGLTVSSGTAALSGGATAPTVSTSDNSTNVATTAWVKAQGYSTGAGTFGSLAATGTTQGTAAAITTVRVVVTTSTSSANGVELPAASAGGFAQVWNEGSYPVSVYPQSGQVIGTLSANTPVQVGVGSKADFVSTSSQWYAN